MEKTSRAGANEKIKSYFAKNHLDIKETKKIKRLAMRHRIRLSRYRVRFCKKCYGDLKEGKIRIAKTNKTVECGKCGFRNRINLLFNY